MSRNFMELLQAKWDQSKFACVGLDTDMDKLPPVQHIKHNRQGDTTDSDAGSSSSGVIFASKRPDFAEAAHRETQKLHDEINRHRAATVPNA